LRLKLSCDRRSVGQCVLVSSPHQELMTIVGILILNILPDESMDLLFTSTIASGPCQSSHSRVQVPQNSRLYFTAWFETPPALWTRSPYLYLPGTGRPSYASDILVFKVTLRLTVGQSVSMSRCRPHSGTCEQILLSSQRLMSESCCLVSAGRPLWRDFGSAICQSQAVSRFWSWSYLDLAAELKLKTRYDWRSVSQTVLLGVEPIEAISIGTVILHHLH
jgi:hypothetical protein